MHSTQNPNRSDPHDVFVDAPDVVPAVHADDGLSYYAHDAMRRPSDSQDYMGSDFSDAPPVPPVDTTFRAADVNNVKARRGWPSMGARAMRGVIGFLLAVCIGVAGALWQSHGDVATAMIAKWVPQLAPTSSPPPESPALAEQPNPSAVQTSEATTAPPQSASVAQAVPDSTASTATAAAVPSSDAAQLQAMAQDLANARQEIERLKASVAQLKASQDQMSRDVAKVSEVRTSDQALRPRVPAPPPRPVTAPPARPIAAPVRRPAPLLRPSQASVAPVYPQAAAPPPMPRQVEPQPLAPAPPQAEPQVSSVLRPPMPVP
jgi:hypothetical protein